MNSELNVDHFGVLEKGETRKQRRQVNSREPCILTVPCLPESPRGTYSCYFSLFLVDSWLCCNLFIFFKAKANNKEQGHMGGKHAIYSAAATGIGPRVPDTRREVCHRGGRPGDNKSRHPHRAHTVRLSPGVFIELFSYLLAFPAHDYLCKSGKLVRRHMLGSYLYTATIERQTIWYEEWSAWERLVCHEEFERPCNGNTWQLIV